MWLRVASSNNNPKCIASFFINCVRENEGLYKIRTVVANYKQTHLLTGYPSILRTDAGTENSSLAYIQPVLRHNHSDEFAKESSHRYGKSTTNQVLNNKNIKVNEILFFTTQRIEALWRHLRVQHIEWWIHFFKVCNYTVEHLSIGEILFVSFLWIFKCASVVEKGL